MPRPHIPPHIPEPNQIRDRIVRDEYRVDPRAVAEAIVRRLLAAPRPPRP